jgi:hypothetical protein
MGLSRLWLKFTTVAIVKGVCIRSFLLKVPEPQQTLLIKLKQRYFGFEIEN